jgi:superfamily II DNA or RNA helicase
MLILNVEHHKTFIVNASDADLDLVREALTVFKKRFMMSPYAEQEWEVTYLLNTRDFSFPSAYLSEVKKFAESKDIEVHITDSRKYPYQSLPRLGLKIDLQLREDQKEAFAAIRENQRGIIMMPTASGKSRVIMAAIASRKVRTLIIVPKTNLQDQMAKQLKEAFGQSKVDTMMPMHLKERIRAGLAKEEHVEFQEDHVLRKKSFKLDMSALSEPTKKTEKKSAFDEIIVKDPSKGRIKFTLDMEAATGGKKEELSPEKAYLKDKQQKKWDKQKEYRNKNQKSGWDKFKEKKVSYKDIYIFCDASLDKLPQEFLDQFEMVIVDECHHAAAKMIRDCLTKLKKAAFRYYFSATPWRDHKAEEQLLASSIGTDRIFELSPEDAIKYASIAKPMYTMRQSPEPKNFMKDKKKWREILEFGIIGNETRNNLIVEDAIKDYDNDENVFIAVDEIAHLELLKERFKNKGLDVQVIHGELPRKVNEKTIETVGKQKRGICIGTMSVGEGTDMPNISSVIMASGGKSSIRFLQRIGRGARKGTEMDKVAFLVKDYFDWFHDTLLRHSLQRKSIFEKYFKEYAE